MQSVAHVLTYGNSQAANDAEYHTNKEKEKKSSEESPSTWYTDSDSISWTFKKELAKVTNTIKCQSTRVKEEKPYRLLGPHER